MINNLQVKVLRENVLKFISERETLVVGEYNYSKTGGATLYGSCYALMTLHYLNNIPTDAHTKEQWADYINQWQDKETGYFLGPELEEGTIDGQTHNLIHLKLHLTTTVLPCLDLLGYSPKWPLSFANEFLHEDSLAYWLSCRSWDKAWLEGNNLLFVIQVLIFCRDVEKHPQANARIEQFFDWLDKEIDPATGLWGTDGHCNSFIAMCGGYHQLLAYYYEHRAINYPEKLIDTTLLLQHPDGGFHPNGGGGACEDVDAVDILVNLYKLYDYRRPDIRFSLRKAVESIVEKQLFDGGFAYRLNEPFMHMGIASTATPPNESNLFSTWFRVHTIALASEILTDTALSNYSWRFNKALSMGWHRHWSHIDNKITILDRLNEIDKRIIICFIKSNLQLCKKNIIYRLNKFKNNF